MTNKIFYGNEKPPKYYMNNKPVQAMYFNNELIYKLITECNNLYFTTQTITVIYNETIDLNEILVVEPEDCNQELIWSTNSNNISVVDGVVTVLNADAKTATVTVQCGDKTANIDVNVEVPCTSISLSKSSYTLDLTGVDSVTFTPTIVPSNTTDKIVWSSDKTSVATVTATSGGAKGTIFANSPGTATISATCGSKSATIVITVEASCTDLYFTEENVVMETGATYDLEPLLVVLPEDCTDVVEWFTYDPNTRMIQEGTFTVTQQGVVTAIDWGYGTIYARCGDCLASIEIYANPITCDSISLDKTSLSFTAQGVTQTLIATPVPSNTSYDVIWSSSNDDVATVDSNGVVTSVGNGTCTITATCNGETAICNVTVNY